MCLLVQGFDWNLKRRYKYWHNHTKRHSDRGKHGNSTSGKYHFGSRARLCVI